MHPLLWKEVFGLWNIFWPYPIGLCLRLLYAEGIRAIVETVRNSKGKIEFHIKANTDEALLRDLIERYNILIS